MIVLADTVLELEQFETERRHHITHFVAISDVNQNVDVRKGPKSCLGIKSLRKSCAFYDCSANFGFCKRLHNSLSVMRQHHLKAHLVNERRTRCLQRFAHCIEFQRVRLWSRIVRST